jgi:hypothetical protein
MAELITTHLEDVSRELWQVLGQYESWKSDPAKCEDIKCRLSRFNESHSDDPDSIDDVIQALSRGFYLIKSALEWQEPAAGHNSIEEPNDTHKARGIQWRLVMAYNGFEMITKTLLLKKGTRGLGPDEFSQFTIKCGLNQYNSLPSPNTKLKNLDKWLTKEPEGKTILNFLGVNKKDADIIQQWILQQQHIYTWVDAVQLAKAIRNATAHGALSASKVKQWGLQKPLLTLSDNLGEIVLAGMRKLI